MADNTITKYTYDSRDRITTIENAIGAITTITYDGESNLLSTISPQGRKTVYEYDELNRLTQIIEKVNDTNDAADIDDAVVAYTYTQRDKIASITNENGGITYLKYDGEDRLVQMIQKTGDVVDQIDANDIVWQYSYDLFGNKISETDPDNRVTFMEYDARNLLAKVIRKVGDVSASPDNDDVVVEFTRDPNANITSTIDPEGRVCYLKYDALNRITEKIRKVNDTVDTIDADDIVVSYTYDIAGNLTHITNPIGVTITRTFDALNRISTVTNGENETDLYEYNDIGSVEKITLANGNVINFTFDDIQRVTQMNDSVGLLNRYAYNLDNERISITDANNNTYEYTYNDLNFLTEIKDPLGGLNKFTFDKVGNVLTSTDRNNQTTTMVYDDHYRKIQEIDALNGTSKITYSNDGDVLSVEDENQNVTTYTYDDLHRLTSQTYADGSTVFLEYNKLGILTKKICEDNRAINYIRDDLDRVTQIDYTDDADDFFTYDKLGRMLTAVKDNWAVSFQYDNANRTIQQIQNGKTVSYSYDIPARKTTITYPSGTTITREADFRGRLSTIKENNTSIVTYAYDLADRILSKSLKNGVVSSFTYDNNDRITQIQHSKNANNLAGFSYSYDAEDNLLSTVKSHLPTHSEKYEYDALHRVKNLQMGTVANNSISNIQTTRSIDYDAVGNWNSYSIDGNVQNRSHNELNQTISQDFVSLSYSQRGNLIDDGKQLYDYDENHRITKATNKSTNQEVSSYQYDAFGRRVKKTTASGETFFYYDSWEVIEEFSAIDNLERQFKQRAALITTP